ncbi:enteric beta-defensin isoform X1 [Bos taurus]|uniref:enteric beta-defensin isoform X1 n=1 Tax=Bos taurus TaxID=9913 RepID=UPI0028CB4A64|nr:enteric beta-defensin isoform X1 [Bos taurus]
MAPPGPRQRDARAGLCFQPKRNYRNKGNEVSQSCLTLCNPMKCSPPASSNHEIFQARVMEWGAISFCIEKQWADSKPWKGKGGAGERVSEGSARSLCPCQGKQASLCPLPHPCPSAELTAREKFVVKGQQESFSWPFHSLISIQVTAPALCYKGHSHDTQGRGSVNHFLITKSTASVEFLPEPGTFIKRQEQPLLQHQPKSSGRQHEAPSPAPHTSLPGPVCWVRIYSRNK